MKARFDPKLKEFMAEIDPIIKKYNVSGFVSVTSKSHGEFKIFFASDSCIYFEGNHGIKIKAKQGIDHERLEASVFSLLSMKDDAIRMFGLVENIEGELRKHIEIDHKQSSIYGHGED